MFIFLRKSDLNQRAHHPRCGCLVTWFCYQLIAKPGNKTATPHDLTHIFIHANLSRWVAGLSGHSLWWRQWFDKPVTYIDYLGCKSFGRGCSFFNNMHMVLTSSEVVNSLSHGRDILRSWIKLWSPWNSGRKSILKDFEEHQVGIV